MGFWVKNTAGNEDATLTMAVWAFVVILIKVIGSGVVLAVGEYTLTMGVIDAGVIGALLTPTLGAYVARRYTDAAKGPGGSP